MAKEMSNGGSASPVEKRPEWATWVRESRGCRTQAAFALLCSVSQVTVSRWEAGTDQPTPGAYARLACVSEQPYRGYFWDLSGLGGEFPQGLEKNQESGKATSTSLEDRHRVETQGGTCSIPILENGLLAGMPVTAAEEQNSGFLALPKSWFIEGSKLYAVQLDDDSMAPQIDSGSIVILDTSMTDPLLLDGSMIVVALKGRLVVRWLYKIDNFYTLVRPSLFWNRAEITPFKPKGRVRIIGAVVKWIASPANWEALSDSTVKMIHKQMFAPDQK